MAELRIGTCSWKYGEWAGKIYSAEKGINFLKEYAGHFDTVEIDQWFWSLHAPGKISLPDTATAREYAESVPDDFRFTVKAPNSVTLTHLYQISKQAPLIANEHFLSREIFFRFLDALDPIRSRVASFMLQFEYLNKQKMPQREEFLDRLGAFLDMCPRDLPIGVETRNPNYLSSNYFNLLNSFGAHHVFLQGYYMPPVTQIHRQYVYNGSRAVLRLHGPDRKGMEEKSGGTWDRIIESRDEELRDIAGMVVDLLGRGIDVIVNVNNHYEGSAPLTIGRFMDMLRALSQETGVPIPSRSVNSLE